MKTKRILAWVLSVMMIFTMLPSFSLTAFAADNTTIDELVFTNMPLEFESGTSVANFIPATLAESDGYEYFWYLEERTSNFDYLATYWPESMDSLAKLYWGSDWVPTDREYFSTTLVDDHVYTFFGVALLNDGYTFADPLSFDVTYSDGEKGTYETPEEEQSSEWAYASWYVDITATQNASVGTSYTVAIDENIENGAVTTNDSTVAKDETVTLTITPDDGYALDTLTVKDASGTDVSISGEGNSRTFTMPASNVTVTATFKRVYKIIIADGIEHGTLTADKYIAAEGELVTLTATPDEGYGKDGIPQQLLGMFLSLSVVMSSLCLRVMSSFRSHSLMQMLIKFLYPQTPDIR